MWSLGSVRLLQVGAYISEKTASNDGPGSD